MSQTFAARRQRARRFHVAASAALTIFASPLIAAETFHGACDGSAVVHLGDGYFLNASDEDNVIRLYRQGSADAVKPFPSLSLFLDTERNSSGRRKEADLEAVARVGNRLYWIGSFGRDSGGKRETSRARFFAEDMKGAGASLELTPVPRPFAGLIDALTAGDSAIAARLRAASAWAPGSGGLNIEALGAVADGSLLVGFRSPLIEGKALIVHLRNPAGVIAGETPLFGAPTLLDLGGLGVRAIEPDRQANVFLLLAGPGADGEDTRLFRWRFATTNAEPLRTIAGDGHGPAEGLMTDSESGRHYVAFDNGSDDCKELSEKDQTFVVEAID